MLQDIDDVLRFQCEERMASQRYKISAIVEKCLTFGRVDHLRIHRGGDDRQGEVLQVPAQTITQNRELELVQVC